MGESLNVYTSGFEGAQHVSDMRRLNAERPPNFGDCSSRGYMNIAILSSAAWTEFQARGPSPPVTRFFGMAFLHNFLAGYAGPLQTPVHTVKLHRSTARCQRLKARRAKGMAVVFIFLFILPRRAG